MQLTPPVPPSSAVIPDLPHQRHRSYDRDSQPPSAEKPPPLDPEAKLRRDVAFMQFLRRRPLSDFEVSELRRRPLA
jgi:hypothetical protein